MTTLLQRSMIVDIAEHELTPINGAIPEDSEDAGTFTDCIVETAQSKGVATSLINAGFIYISGDGKDSVIGLTDAGFAEYQKIKAMINQ